MKEWIFHPTATGYDATNAYGLAQAAKLAYAPEAEIRRTTDIQWDFTKFRFFNKRDTQGFAAANDTMYLLAFRGTQPTHMRDWMTDIKIKQVPTPAGPVHSGFKEALDAVWDEVLVTARIFLNRRQPIWITGHSLGAALASLALERFKEENIAVSGVYTFGSPRVGAPTYCKSCDTDFQGRIFRIVNNNDVVTRIPQRVMGYDHLGTLKYFDHEGKLTEGLSGWDKFLDRIQGRWEDFFTPGTDGIHDHAIDRYIENLKQALL